MEQSRCVRYLRLVACEAFGLILVSAIFVVWILGWTGCLGPLPHELNIIQSYSGVINSVYGVVNTLIVVALGFKAKTKISKQLERERERNQGIAHDVTATRDAIQNMRDENDERLSLIQNEVVTTYHAVGSVNDCASATNSAVETMATQQREDHCLIFENMRTIIAQNKELLESNRKMADILDSQSAPVRLQERGIVTTQLSPVIKMSLVGDVCTGKTCLLQRWMTNEFLLHYKATIGVDFCLRKLSTNIGEANLQVWDFAGQERFGNMTAVYFRETFCFVILIDVTRKITLSGALRWLEMCKKQRPRAFVIFLCNKIDLIRHRELDQATISEALGDNPCYWVSAKTGENVEHALSLAALGTVVSASVTYDTAV